MLGLLIATFAAAGTAAEPAPAGGVPATTAPQVVIPAVFTFSPSATVDKDRIFLGQLATCAGEPVICEEAYGVDLGPAPAPGKTLIWPKAKLQELLAREWDAGAIQLHAPDAGVRIAAAGEALDELAIEERLRVFLAEEFAGREDLKVEVMKVSFPSHPRLRPGALDVAFPDWRGASEQKDEWLLKKMGGTQRVEVFFGVEGQETVYPANVTLRLSKKIPVARENLARGDVIEAEDLEVDWVEMSRALARCADDERSVVGKRLKAPVSVGQPIPLGQLETPMVIKKGQLARLILSKNGLSVSGQVKALGAGGYGEAIEAVYPATKKKIRVRVVDSSTVEYLQ